MRQVKALDDRLTPEELDKICDNPDVSDYF